MALQFRRASYAATHGTLVPINVPGIRSPIFLRTATSDSQVFHQHFIAEEMGFPVSHTPEYILDGGANIGLASLFLATRFPGARIAAVEPEGGNFELLCRNTSAYPNITPINAAIWSSDRSLYVHEGDDAGAWSYRVSSTTNAESPVVDGVTIPTLLRRLEWPKFDLIKLDIEGGEKEVFGSGPTGWLAQTSILAIEFHDRFVPGSTDAVMSAIDSDVWTQETYGEYTIFQARSHAP